MASRWLEEERSGPLRPNGSTAAMPTTRAATARNAVARALAVLADPGPPQLTILGHLERSDKMRLGSACTSLRQASLAWFPEVTVDLKVYKIELASLAAWLQRHKARLHLSAHPLIAFQVGASEVEWNAGLTALPSSLVTSLAVCLPALPAAVSTLTALTRLELKHIGTAAAEEGAMMPLSISAHHLRPLLGLRHLSVYNINIGSNAEDLLLLPALLGLQALQLRYCRLERTPPALTALTRLTALNLSMNRLSALAPLATLHCLQELDLSGCSLTAVPQELSALTALTRLKLSNNRALAGGWQHLPRLTQLQYLELNSCSLVAVPQQLSALAALTQLLMSMNKLASGWQHLLPLTQLCEMGLSSCGLTAVPQQLSALMALTRLNLAYSKELTGGWQHLLPLNLQDLDFECCSLTALPQQLAALTTLTRLDLSGNGQLAISWAHLLPLTRLHKLRVDRALLPGGKVPLELETLPHLRIEEC